MKNFQPKIQFTFNTQLNIHHMYINLGKVKLRNYLLSPKSLMQTSTIYYNGMLQSSILESMLKPPKCVTSSLRHQSFPITFLLLIVYSFKFLSRDPRTRTNSIPLARMKSIFWYMFGFLLVSFLSLQFPLTFNGYQKPS